MLEVQDQAGERVLSLGHNCVAASLTAFLWTEESMKSMVREAGLVWGGLSKRPEVNNGDRRTHVGKGGAKGGAVAQPPAFSRAAAQSHCFLRQYPQRKNTTTVLGYFPGF